MKGKAKRRSHITVLSPIKSTRQKRPRAISPTIGSSLDTSINAPKKRIRLEFYPNFHDIFDLKPARIALRRVDNSARIPEQRHALKPLFVRLDRAEVEKQLQTASCHSKIDPVDVKYPPDVKAENGPSDDDEDSPASVKRIVRSPILKVKFPFFNFKKKERADVKGISDLSDDDNVSLHCTITGNDLDENANVKVEKKRKGDESDDSSDDDDDDDVMKIRERNMADNKRMLQEIAAQFGGNDAFKRESRRASLPASGDKENGARSGRRSLGPAYLRYSNRKSPPRLRERRDDGNRPNDHLRRPLPEFHSGDEENDFKVYLDDEDREPEGVFFVQKGSSGKMASERVIIPVESVTAEHLSNVSNKLTNKVYDPINGTSCHQCRQKTIDTKSCCRSDTCVGVRGQFCGGCLMKRYGEDVREALLDPDWNCPPCRGICNCSICRNKAGKCATGILFNYSQEQGYKSVHHLLAKKEDD